MIHRLIHQYGSELLYHLGGATYDWSERVLWDDAWKCWRAAVIELVPPASQTILDLGAGTGAMGRAYLPSGTAATYIAVEPSRPMIGPRIKRPFGEQVIQGEAARLPLRDGCIDAVLIGFPGPYIWSPVTWDELARVLGHEGVVVTLIGGTPAPELPRSLLGRTVGWMVYGRYETTRGQDHALPGPVPLVRHPRFIGYWRGVETDRGMAHVWFARKRDHPSGCDGERS